MPQTGPGGPDGCAGDDRPAADADAGDRGGPGAGGTPVRPGRLVRTMRALSGSVAAGVVLLAAGIIVVSIMSGRRGIPGPGAESLIVHLFACAAAVLLQRFADRARGAAAVLCSLGVFCVAGAVLWTQWWG